MINMPRTITGSCSPIRCKHTLDILPVSVYINPMYAEKCLRQWQRAPVSIHSVPVYPAQGHGGWSMSQLRLGKTCTCWADHQPVTGPTRKASHLREICSCQLTLTGAQRERRPTDIVQTLLRFQFPPTDSHGAACVSLFKSC